MSVWRWLIAILIVINAISGLGPAITAAAYKLGLYAPSKDSALLALLSSLSWPVVGIWLASMVTFLLSAGLLISYMGRPFILYVLAFVSDLSVFLFAQGPAYDAAFTRGQKTLSYVVFILLVPVGVAVWHLEHSQGNKEARE